MEAHEAILMTLHANDELLGPEGVGDRPVGRTAMQKLIYFETRILKTGMYFNAYYYGPFSPGVSEDLARLEAFGYVYEYVPPSSFLGYEYHLTRDGKEFAADLSKTEPYAKIRDVVKTCSDFCDLRQLALAYAAKMHFLSSKLYRSKNKSNKNDIAALGKNFGWVIDPKDVRDGKKLLRVLNLD